jgi:hypothetical protein
MRSLTRAILLVALCSVTGCASYIDRLTDVRNTFAAGDLEATSKVIEKGLRKRKEANCLKLERAIVSLAEGRPKDAEQTLREVRDQFDHLEQAAIGENALAMLTDSTNRAYSGEDYEKVLIRAMLALSNLMTDGQDATAYSLQIADKQQQIIQAGTDKDGENPKLSYKGVALGAYIHGMLREATHNSYDDAARSISLVCNWEPAFPYGRQDLDRVQHGHHSAPGNGVLYVFSLVGMGPYKEETLEVASTVSLLIADRILSAVSSQTLPPTIAPIKVPQVVLSSNDVCNVLVSVNDHAIGRTETITDVGRMATEQYQAIYPRVIAEAVVRRVVKKGVIFGGKEVLGVKKDSLEGFAFDLLGVAWEATEAADTRCWGLLPDKIQVLRVELPAGTHQVSLQPLGGSGVNGAPSTETVTISNGRNTYMLANFPTTRLVGKVLVSQP